MFCFDVIYLMRFILLEAIAASPVCHQRNAIFGRGAYIFVLTHFPSAKRNPPHQVRCKKYDRVCSGIENSFPLGDARRKATGIQANWKMI
jgi:hypothetical protein